MPKVPNTLGERLAGDTLDGLLRRRINVENIHHVRLMEALGELVHQMLGASITVGLEHGVDAPEFAQLRGGKGSANLRGMVAVVVNDGDTSRLASGLESPVAAGVGSDRLANRFEIY